ncbi:MAG: S8 family serine peptidase [Planctomycetales bacterium]|nr:S8 family serine peptidase [Planctomycetales bacterium]
MDYSHPDLAANVWTNPGEIAGDGIDNDGNGFIDDVHGYDFVSNDGDPMDDHNHGTHVAGTIGAVANNSIGVAGVAWNVQIMAVKFLSAQGSGSIAAAVNAIQYAVDNGAVISNHSWGFNGSYSQVLADAIEYARSADHVVVAAAGNGGPDLVGDDNDSVAFYPGNFVEDNLIAVAATDHNDALATFSNYGLTQVDLGAPGVGILSTTRNNTYSTFSGTSMATPHVTGAVALLRSQHPDWSYAKIRDRIFDTVDPLPALENRTTTGGRLNVAAAVALDFSGPIVVGQNPSGEVMKAQDRVTVTFDERIEPGTLTSEDVVSFVGPLGQINVIDVVPVPDSAGRTFQIIFDSQSALGDYTLNFGPDVSDVFGNLMDQNANGVNGESVGDRYAAQFTIIPDTVGPYIVNVFPDSAIDVPLDRIRITFDEPISPGSFTPAGISGFTGPGGTINVTSIAQVSAEEYDVVFPLQNALGAYGLTIGGPITDIAGNLIDLDQDGIGGEVNDDQLDVQFEIQRWLYADHVVDFSSQFTSTAWAATQALGAPNTFSYGDIETAWAPRFENGTQEFLTVGFAEPLLASGVVIRETFGNGHVRKVEARNAITGQYINVADPIDISLPNVPFDFQVTWPQTEYPVDAIRITIDTDHNQNAYEEIDSVQLRGVTVPDTDGARVEESSLDGSTEGPVDRVELTFDEPIQDGTFTLDDVVAFTGPSGDVVATSVNRLSSTQYEITFPPQTVYGDYSLTIGPDILDLDGLPMNQDEDSVDGETLDDQYVINFNIELWQYADAIVSFSSQFGASSWSAAQALGPADTFVYGDSRDAWAPANINGTTEHLTVAFAEPVLASGVQIRENFGNGFVRSIQVREADTGLFWDVSTGPDDSLPGQVVDYTANWPLTSFPVDAV